MALAYTLETKIEDLENLFGYLGAPLPSPYKASFQALSVNAFR